ncbi:MAG: acyltransferase family protein [Acidimicrobiales bacterium]
MEQSPKGATPKTIGDSFDPRRNSLNALRLMLAAMVVVSHSITIGGFGSERIIGQASLGDIAVNGFFGISGFLIAESAAKHGVFRYLWMRSLRILPAFWVCLVVVAFGFGPLGWIHVHTASGGFFSAPNGPFRYIVVNSLLHMSQWQVAGTPAHVPHPLAWNGSLWTLQWEFLCYLGMAILGVTRLLRRRRAVASLTGVVWLVQLSVYLHPTALVDHSSVEFALRFGSIFLVGTVLRLYQHRIPDSKLLAGAAVVLVAVGSSLRDPNLIAGPALAYLLLWLGVHLPLHRLGARNDISYGVYIYAFPVQQLLATWNLQRFGYLIFTASALVFTIPFAMGSWFGIERRVLHLKSWSPRTWALWASTG